MEETTISDLPVASGVDATADYLPIDRDSVVETERINRNTFLGITGSPVGNTDTQTLSNKTLGNTNAITVLDSNFTLQDNSDNTKQAQFQLSGITTATTRTYTLPNASVTLASLTGTETLTNKTLTSPTITGGTIANPTLTVDSIAGFSSATVVTAGGVQLNNGTIGTASAVTTASIADGAVTPAKLQSGTGAGWSWTSWSPTWANLTVGNGTVQAFYRQIGKTIEGTIGFVLGTTSAMGSDPTFTLPVTAAARYSNAVGRNYWLGGIHFEDLATAGYAGFIRSQSTTVALLVPMVASGTYVSTGSITSTLPFTWTTGDFIYGTFMYEAA